MQREEGGGLEEKVSFLEHDPEGCRGCRREGEGVRICLAEGGLHPWACSRSGQPQPGHGCLRARALVASLRACDRWLKGGRAVKIQTSGPYVNAAWGERGGGNESCGSAAPPEAPSFPAKCSRRTDCQACPWREGPRSPRPPPPPRTRTYSHAGVGLGGHEHVRKTKLGLRGETKKRQSWRPREAVTAASCTPSLPTPFSGLRPQLRAARAQKRQRTMS